MKLTRRTLLKLGAAGAMRAMLPSIPQIDFPARLQMQQDDAAISYARTLNASAAIFGEPNLKSKKVGAQKSTEVLPIYEEIETESGSSYNKIWYRVKGGYIHSAQVHPVPWALQHSIDDAGDFGFWAELSVPWFDVRSAPNLSASRNKYRYYGGTVYKVKKVVKAEEIPPEDKLVFGAIDEYWYQIEDEQFPSRYFVPARYMRIITEDEFEPISPDVDPLDKKIVVDTKTQWVRAFEKDEMVFECRCASGKSFKGLDFSTTKGKWFTYRKTPSQHMYGGAVGDDGSFDLPGIPWVTYFVTTGIAFHGTYWHNDYGQPRSHGCVNVSAENSKWLWRWTLPENDVNLKNWYTQSNYRKPDPLTVTTVVVE
jgi:hypothetical protein